MPRGIRNKNPLNIEKSNSNWQGKTEGKDSRFETFIDEKYGIRAGVKLLRNYQRIYNLDTVSKIINRFAPTFENDTNSYAYHIAKALNVGVDDKINTNDNNTMLSMITAMIKHENGIQPYPQSTIQEGINLA